VTTHHRLSRHSSSTTADAPEHVAAVDKSDDDDPWSWARFKGEPQPRPAPPPPPSLRHRRYDASPFSAITTGGPLLHHPKTLLALHDALSTCRPLALARIFISLGPAPAAEMLLVLPSPTFTTLLSALDPLDGPLDPAFGVHIPAAIGQFSHAAASLNDVYGVRHVHLALFPILLAALHARLRHGRPIVPQDYAMLLRCAGACQSIVGAQAVWRLMDMSGHLAWRSTALFADFAQARFLTLPPYYQFDKARVRVRPGNLYRATTGLPAEARRHLDNLRVSLNLHRHERHGILPPEEAGAFNANIPGPHDLAVSWLLRAQGPVARVTAYTTNHFAMMDEARFCATLVAWARAGARHKMMELLAHFYGLRLAEKRRGCRVVTAGAFRFPPGSPRQLTAALAHAVVDAFGATGDIRIGAKLAIAIAAT
jgi:hypothetical protein